MKIINIGGGLGNQMFQYAFFLSLKEKEKCFIDTSYYNLNDVHNGYELEKIFCISTKKLNIYNNKNLILRFFLKILREILKKIGCIYLEKRELNVEKNLKRLRNKKIIFLDGNWCSERYFYQIKEKIKEIYSFSKIKETRNILIAKKIEKTESVSIHVRRGDYLLPENKIYSDLVDIDYYNEAINIINKKVENPVFFIFSNDIEWCKENLKIKDAKNMYYIDWNSGKNSYRDMQLMSMCKHNIIPHSTFSWWGAWLNKNPNKIVIAPETWFNPQYLEIEINTLDLIPDTWIKIKNYKGKK